MLDDLVSVIETLQQRIRGHGQSLRENEIRTRTALIDPLLQALGWDVSDPVLVTPEYSVGGGRADYALNSSDLIPAAIVEAKRLGSNLSDDLMQMLNYANARGVRYAAVTDGDVWELYEVFKQAPLEDRRLLNLRISTMSGHELSLLLLLLWRPNLGTGQPVAANEPVIGWETEEFETRSPQPVIPAAPSFVAPPLPSPATVQSTPGGWVPLTDFDPPAGSAPPGSIRFPDGQEREIRRWYEILVTVATWLNETGRLTTSNVPVSSSRNKHIVHVEPFHPHGDQFLRNDPIADGKLAVSTHVSARQSRGNSTKLLEHCGVDPATVQLQVRQ